MTTVNGSAPKVTLYTNHNCPYAHRAHIVLRELGLEYEEVIIDLTRPREGWYLEVNPRGLVPSMSFDNQILTESAIVSQFLADVYPSPLLPPTDSVANALKRARINFFVDTWNSRANGYLFTTMRAGSDEEKEKLTSEFLGVVAKEIEPLLADAAPFFGGSEKLTFAEAMVAPFVLRFYGYASHGLLPKGVSEGLDGLPNFKKWADAIRGEESVVYVWDEGRVVEATRRKLAQGKAQAKV